MKLSEQINSYAENYTPYMDGFINHLPMAQLALYRMSGSLERVKAYSDYFINHFNINRVKNEYPEAEKIEECLGERSLYESCLDKFKEEISLNGVEYVLRWVLNDYDLGMSSGIFHVLIRLAYAVEGYEYDPALSDEVARALAYYITAYREAGIFSRAVESSKFAEEVERLKFHKPIKDIVMSQNTLGKRMKALYATPQYKDIGFVTAGSEKQKIITFLEYLLSIYNHSPDIFKLHFITSLHALVNLKDYFNDFNRALDIHQTCCLTHLLASSEKEVRANIRDIGDMSWEEILTKGSESKDVHTIKLTYTCHQLYKIYSLEKLKKTAIIKIEGGI